LLHRAGRHVVAVACLTAAAWWLLLPLTSRLSSHVPGVFPGDNITFVWDTWWFRRAFAAHSSGIWCDLLFAPYGTSLLLHTHTILQAVLGVLLCPTGSPVLAHNVVLAAGVVANGLCTYALAFHYTRRSLPSLVAGVMFTWSTFVLVHLAGHFNLVHAWVLPLAAWCTTRFLERPSTGRGVTLGGVLATIAYSDYYFFVYAVATALLLAVTRRFTFSIERRPGPAGRPAIALAVIAAVITVLAAVIVGTGGWVLYVADVPISMRGTRNLAAAATAALLAAAALTFRLRVDGLPGRTLPLAKQWAAPAAVFAVLLLPLAAAAAGLILQGGYASQPILWQSSPAGIDLVTMVEGPPRHLIVGELVGMSYRTARISSIEQSGWISLVGLLGIGAALLRYRDQPDVRAWLVLAAAFFAVALGPFVRIDGVDTGIPGPFALLRYVPPFSNARMPGRAIVIVQLAAAVLTAMVLARRTTQWKNAAWWLVFLVLEAVPHPTPLLALPRPDAVDAAIVLSRAPGSVLELPVGLRDGFGMIGWLDHRALAHQMHHERPLVGGFVARMSPTLRERYLQTPIFVAALGVSDLDRPLERSLSARAAADQGVAFLVVNRDLLDRPRSLDPSTLEAAGFRHVTSDDGRELYAVEPRP
jgi:hypothetical protein